MKKVFSALLIVVLSACSLSDIPGFGGTPAPQADSATQSIAPSTTPLPSSPTLAPATETPVVAPASPTTEIVFAPSVTPPSADVTATTIPPTNPPVNLTTTLVTATSGATSGNTTLTPTLGVLLYGTQPPKVPYTTITIWNKSEAQAYISLQVTMNNGEFSIIEYPVKGRIQIEVPTGSYVFVAWVGGNKMDGGFQLRANDTLTILLYKNRVVLK